MATTTTNFGWDIPQSTDLVKDGATAIAALGQDIDTAFVDFKGGTTGQVLKKTSGTDLDVEWGTASSGLTLINTTSFSGVSSHSLTQDTFSSAYKDYRLVYKITTTQSSNITYRFRTAGSDNSTSNYQYQNFSAIGGSVSASNDTGTSLAITSTGGAVTQFFTMDLFRPQIAENTIFYQNNILNLQGSSPNIRFYYGQFGATTIFDSGTIITSAGTLSGSVSVYGYTT
jgi:hypothetical protein